MELSKVPVAERFSWAATRRTRRIEDKACSLLGSFDVNMPTLHGEGLKAVIRLQEHIMAESAGMSIFLWSDRKRHQDYTGLQAPSLAYFRGSGQAKIEPNFQPVRILSYKPW